MQVRDQSKPEKFGQSTVVINVRRNSLSPVFERTPYGVGINYNQAPGLVYTTTARDTDLTVRIILLQYFIHKIKSHVHTLYCHRISFFTRKTLEIFIKVWDINWSIWSRWFEIIASHLYKLMKMLIVSGYLDVWSNWILLSSRLLHCQFQWRGQSAV